MKIRPGNSFFLSWAPGPHVQRIDTPEGLWHIMAPRCVNSAISTARGKSGTSTPITTPRTSSATCGRRNFIKRFFESPDHLAKGEKALDKLDRIPPFFTRGIRREDHQAAEGQSFRSGRPHRGHRAHPRFHDLGRPSGLHLPPRVLRPRAPLLLRHQHGAAGRRDCEHPQEHRRLLSHRPSDRRARVPAQGRSPGPDAGERRGRALPHRLVVRDARSWAASATARCPAAWP